MGINTPAHLVIIKSTEYYVNGGYQEYSESQVLQMIGRAGRPQFDSEAVAIIMTKEWQKKRYENLVEGVQPVESNLHRHLTEHLNSEVVLRTIPDVAFAMNWIRSTFLYIRTQKNPVNYKLPRDLTKAQTEKRLQDWCLRELNGLVRYKLALMTDGYDVLPTAEGKIMAQFCINFETMKLFMDIKGRETLNGLLKVLIEAQEFKDIVLRMNERKALNSLNKNGASDRLRFPIGGKVKSQSLKINCLIQATLGCLQVFDTALIQDRAKIFRIGKRLTQGLVQLLWLQDNDVYRSLLSAILLAKCFISQLWDNSEHITRQLPGIGPVLASHLVAAKKISFMDILSSNPRELELILNRLPPFGNTLIESVKVLPQFEIQICATAEQFLVEVKIKNYVDVLRSKNLGDMFYLLIGNSNNNITHKSKFPLDSLMKRGGFYKINLNVSDEPSQTIFVHVLSKNWVGLDVSKTFGIGEAISPESESGDNHLPGTKPNGSQKSTCLKRRYNSRDGVCSDKVFPVTTPNFSTKVTTRSTDKFPVRPSQRTLADFSFTPKAKWEKPVFQEKMESIKKSRRENSFMSEEKELSQEASTLSMSGSAQEKNFQPYKDQVSQNIGSTRNHSHSQNFDALIRNPEGKFECDTVALFQSSTNNTFPSNDANKRVIPLLFNLPVKSNSGTHLTTTNSHSTKNAENFSSNIFEQQNFFNSNCNKSNAAWQNHKLLSEEIPGENPSKRIIKIVKNTSIPTHNVTGDGETMVSPVKINFDDTNILKKCDGYIPHCTSSHKFDQIKEREKTSMDETSCDWERYFSENYTTKPTANASDNEDFKESRRIFHDDISMSTQSHSVLPCLASINHLKNKCFIGRRDADGNDDGSDFGAASIFDNTSNHSKENECVPSFQATQNLEPTLSNVNDYLSDNRHCASQNSFAKKYFSFFQEEECHSFPAEKLNLSTDCNTPPFSSKNVKIPFFSTPTRYPSSYFHAQNSDSPEMSYDRSGIPTPYIVAESYDFNFEQNLVPSENNANCLSANQNNASISISFNQKNSGTSLNAEKESILTQPLNEPHPFSYFRSQKFSSHPATNVNFRSQEHQYFAAEYHETQPSFMYLRMHQTTSANYNGTVFEFNADAENSQRTSTWNYSIHAPPNFGGARMNTAGGLGYPVSLNPEKQVCNLPSKYAKNDSEPAIKSVDNNSLNYSLWKSQLTKNDFIGGGLGCPVSLNPEKEVCNLPSKYAKNDSEQAIKSFDNYSPNYLLLESQHTKNEFIKNWTKSIDFLNDSFQKGHEREALEVENLEVENNDSILPLHERSTFHFEASVPLMDPKPKLKSVYRRSEKSDSKDDSCNILRQIEAKIHDCKQSSDTSIGTFGGTQNKKPLVGKSPFHRGSKIVVGSAQRKEKIGIGEASEINTNIPDKNEIQITTPSKPRSSSMVPHKYNSPGAKIGQNENKPTFNLCPSWSEEQYLVSSKQVSRASMKDMKSVKTSNQLIIRPSKFTTFSEASGNSTNIPDKNEKQIITPSNSPSSSMVPHKYNSPSTKIGQNENKPTFNLCPSWSEEQYLVSSKQVSGESMKDMKSVKTSNQLIIRPSKFTTFSEASGNNANIPDKNEIQITTPSNSRSSSMVPHKYNSPTTKIGQNENKTTFNQFASCSGNKQYLVSSKQASRASTKDTKEDIKCIKTSNQLIIRPPKFTTFSLKNK